MKIDDIFIDSYLNLNIIDKNSTQKDKIFFPNISFLILLLEAK